MNCLPFTKCPIFPFLPCEKVLLLLLKCDLLLRLILQSTSKTNFFIAASDEDNKAFDNASRNCIYSSKNTCEFT